MCHFLVFVYLLWGFVAVSWGFVQSFGLLPSLSLCVPSPEVPPAPPPCPYGGGGGLRCPGSHTMQFEAQQYKSLGAAECNHMQLNQLRSVRRGHTLYKEQKWCNTDIS